MLYIWVFSSDCTVSGVHWTGSAVPARDEITGYGRLLFQSVLNDYEIKPIYCTVIPYFLTQLTNISHLLITYYVSENRIRCTRFIASRFKLWFERTRPCLPSSNPNSPLIILERKEQNYIHHLASQHLFMIEIEGSFALWLINTWTIIKKGRGRSEDGRSGASFPFQ